MPVVGLHIEKKEGHRVPNYLGHGGKQSYAHWMIFSALSTKTTTARMSIMIAAFLPPFVFMRNVQAYIFSITFPAADLMMSVSSVIIFSLFWATVSIRAFSSIGY